MNESLNRIRPQPDVPIPTRKELIWAVFIFALGAIAGFLAKNLDNVQILGEIGTDVGVWILMATLLAAWSRSPRAAALHVLVFFAAMLVVYYVYSMFLFGFFPKYYFIAWGGVALLTPIAGYLAWYARGNGWAAAFCAALPISLLLVDGYPFFYTRSIAHGFDILAAILLLVMLNHQGRQRARIGLIASVAFFVFWKIHIFSLLFGGI